MTRPAQGMRAAMARAEVGDDVFGEDPTVNALQERVAALTGKPAALFLPSGTMANLSAVLAQTRPGDSILLHRDAHPFQYESGNLAMVAGVMPIPVGGAYGILDAHGIVGEVVGSEDHHRAPTTLVMVEHTTNRGGGAIYPLETLAHIAAIAKDCGLRVHCDGARIFHAVVETGIPISTYARCVDTLSFCFSKGLGAPAGSILVGTADVIDRAHRYRKMLGGGMRQAGVLAAAALYALDHHVERLREDHRRARRFREHVEDVPGISFPLPSPTNIVYVEVRDALAMTLRLKELGVLVLPVAPNRIRAVFHLDVDDAGLDRAIDAFRKVACA